MKPTAHLRWNEWSDYEDRGGIRVPVIRRDLLQFWEIGEGEADILLPRVAGPDGAMGRWRVVE